KKLNLRLAFPKIYELEQEYGSLLKGLILTMLKNSKGKKKGEASGSPMGKLLSFRQGMGQLCEALVKQYEDCIHLDEVVESVDRVGEGFSIVTQKMKYFADELFVCSPAHSASAFLKTLDPVLSELLGKIQYAPMAVVGLVYPKAALGHIPQGFGYLIPSSEKSEVQGVLFPGNVFPGRTADDLFMFRVMIGGSSYPDIMKRTKDELVETAEYELKKRFAINGRTVTEFLALWPNAIPQYDQEYAYLKDGIVYEVSKFPNFHLVANYLGGVSINDCTSNAQAAAEKSALA
ncbi:MAG: protoporphyrinogen oxidase, partial [Bacteroidetes bacterium RIFCSPHIGHO2_02_FULL_44_7]